MTSQQQLERIQKRLRVVRPIALADLVLLIALVTSSLTKQRAFVSILGPLHGINFLLLLVVVAVAAIDGLWAWWFPVIVLFTAGPPGAFIGEWIIQRRIKTQLAGGNDGIATEGTVTAQTRADTSRP